MPMYKNGLQVRSVYANEGVEQKIGFVGGTQVYGLSVLPFHTHLFNVVVADSSSNVGEDNYGLNLLESAGSVEPVDFTGSASNELVDVMRVGQIDGTLDGFGWSFSFLDYDIAPTTYQYFRISISENNGQGGFSGMQEVELSTSAGGSDITDPGMDCDSSGNFFEVIEWVPELAINNNKVDHYNSWFSNVGPPNWWSVDTAGSYVIEELVIWAHHTGNSNYLPKDFVFEGSNDNSNWDILKSFSNVTGWVAGESKTFDVSTSIPPVTDRPGTGDGNALSVVWVETLPGEFLLLYDAADINSGVFHTINQTRGHEMNGVLPGWSLEGINPGRNADANPWKDHEGTVRRCLLVLNNSIPEQNPSNPNFHYWVPNLGNN